MLRKITLLSLLIVACFNSFAAVVPVITGTATSANARAPQGSQRYIRTVYIITAAEMAASGIPASSLINAIGWSYSAAQSIATSGNLKVYLQNTTDLAYSKPSTTWTNSSNGVIDNMTLVSDATETIPSIVGNFDVTFSNGSPFVYTGDGLYVAFEYSNPSGAISTNNTALCNNAAVGGVDGLKNAFGTSMPAAVTGTSLFRPVTRLGYPLPNDGTVHDVYTLGNLPISLATPHIISARIINSGDNALINLSVTLSVTGANSFTDVQVVNLLPGNSTIVSFAAFTPTSLGTNSVNVSIPADDILTNNSVTLGQDVTTTVLSYSNSAPPSSSVGFNTGTGILAAKYTVTANTGVLGINAFIYNTANIAGNTLTGIVLDNAGTIIGTSLPHVVTASELGTNVNFPITIPPVINNQDFYVGILQSANAVSGYFPIGVQPEPLPARPNAYYSFGVAGGAATNYINLGRVMIEAVMSGFPLAANDIKVSVAAARNDARISWTTTRETVEYFHVERSQDGRQFTKVGQVKGQSGLSGNGYLFLDKDALSSTVPAWHYRIKQVETNGDISYSALVTLRVQNSSTFDLSVINPVTDRIHLSVNLAEASNVSIAIADVQGRNIYTANKSLHAGTNYISLDDLDRLPSGSYLISVTDGNNKISRKLIQQ